MNGTDIGLYVPFASLAFFLSFSLEIPWNNHYENIHHLNFQTDMVCLLGIVYIHMY